ncbi:hypothetical protein BDN70DRAFT_882799 [Pholiota conissans]|uniref:Uncharacterized protein n=1 Tax=Pholiota conissans TaxID=109636 RepID=A0A9P6CY01_9AGAR|nr:hypothetical protein BDN70DRAFT_882799 [Pholiota conissans]
MSSRYSRIFLRPPKDTTISSESWGGSSAEPRSTPSAGFSYPPSSSVPSHDLDSPMASPPHPYTLGATHSPTETSFPQPPRQTGHLQQNASEISTEKRPDPGIGFQYSLPQRTQTRSLARTQSIIPPVTLSPLFILLLFLPVPPLLSIIYIVAGHAILRASNSSPNSIYLSPIVASLEAGATGGVILSLPIAFLLYLLIYPNKPRDSPEDFFEDDNSRVETQEKWLRYTGYAVAAFLILAIGGIAGPLGVTCLSTGSLDEFVGNKRLLSTSAAAAAGFVGGVVLVFGSLVMGILAISSRTMWVRSKRSSS